MTKGFYNFLLSCVILLTLFSCTSKKSPSFPSELVGDWYTIRGDVESYSFLTDSSGGIYVGTLHDRPVVNGKWKVQDNKFIITPLNNEEEGTPIFYDFKILNDTLILNDGQEVYTKTVPLSVQRPEVKILEDLKSDLGYLFSPPIETEVNWIDGPLKGYSVSVNSTISSDYMNNIANYIIDAGFSRDTLAVTEICTGFWTDYADGKIILTLCSSQDPEATDDKITIIVSSALKK